MNFSVTGRSRRNLGEPSHGQGFSGGPANKDPIIEVDYQRLEQRLALMAEAALNEFDAPFVAAAIYTATPLPSLPEEVSAPYDGSRLHRRIWKKAKLV